MVQEGCRFAAVLWKRQLRALLEPADVRDHWRGQFLSTSLHAIAYIPYLSFHTQTIGRSRSTGALVIPRYLLQLSSTGLSAFIPYNPPTNPLLVPKPLHHLTALISLMRLAFPEPVSKVHFHSSNRPNGSVALSPALLDLVANLSLCRVCLRLRGRHKAVSHISERWSPRRI